MNFSSHTQYFCKTTQFMTLKLISLVVLESLISVFGVFLRESTPNPQINRGEKKELCFYYIFQDTLPLPRSLGCPPLSSHQHPHFYF